MIGKEAKNVQVLVFSYSQTLPLYPQIIKLFIPCHTKIASESVHSSISRHWADFEMIDVK